MKNLSAVGQIVHDNDHDRFVTLIFADKGIREDLFALYAFNYEVSKTREVVTDTTLGLIRLTWWREAIDEIYDGKTPRKHEVVEPLALAIKRHTLPKKLFETLIYAREFDLEDALPGDLKGLCKYVEFTVEPLLKLSAMIMSKQKYKADFRALAYVIGLTGILRSVPFHAAQDRCYLPKSMLSEQGLTKEDIIKGDKSGDVQYVIFEIANYIYSELETIKHNTDYNADYRALYLQGSVAKQHLRVLKKTDYNPYIIREGQRISMLRLLWSYYLKRL